LDTRPGGSDHVTFWLEGINVSYATGSGETGYHRPEDTPSLVLQKYMAIAPTLFGGYALHLAGGTLNNNSEPIMGTLAIVLTVAGGLGGLAIIAFAIYKYRQSNRGGYVNIQRDP